MAMICWSLWINRNGKVWRNKFDRVSTILNMAGQHLFQWQQAKKNTFIIYEPAALNHGSMYWERPREGWFKCNVDAATFHSRGKVSFGAVIRCSEGRFFAAKCTPLLGHFGACEAKALGVREALSWIKCIHALPIIIEIDCLEVFNAISNNTVYPNGFGLVIDGCRALARSIGEVTFSFVRRSANTVAHIIARVGGSMSGPSE